LTHLFPSVLQLCSLLLAGKTKMTYRL